MIAALALFAAVQAQGQVDLKLLWKPGEKYVYGHEGGFGDYSFKGDVTVTVGALDNGVFTINTSEITYSDPHMQNTPAGEIKLSEKGVLQPQKNVPAIVLFTGMALPPSPVNPGDTYHVSFDMPDPGGTYDLTGTFVGYENDGIVAKLSLTGNIEFPGHQYPVTIDQRFDTKRGIFLSSVVTMPKVLSMKLTLKG